MSTVGSTVLRRQLGRRLRRLREQAGKTERDVEATRLVSRTKLWRIESGRAAVKVGDVRGLCWLYGADPRTTDLMSNLALGTGEQGWWESYADVVPAWFNLYVGLEATAATIRIYDPELVHGLFQTPDYTRAILATAQQPGVPGGIEQMVSLRTQRQDSFFSRTPAPRVVAVFSEAVLARQVGGAAVTCAQLKRLHELSTSDCGISVRVLEFSTGAHAAMLGAFTVMEFTDANDPTVVYLESQTGARYLERPEEIDEYQRIFQHVHDRATPIERYGHEQQRLAQVQ